MHLIWVIAVGVCCVSLLHLNPCSAADRDFYKILNIERTATKHQIKKAYRELAKKYHPDKRKNDPRASDTFQDINAAYEALSDPEKREIYDRHGEKGLKESGHESGGGGGMDPFSSFFGDMFDMDGSGGGRNSEKKMVRGGNVDMDLYVTLEELYNGNFVEVIRHKSVKKPASGTRQCNCRAEMKMVSLGPGQFQMHQERVCDECPNVRFVPEEKPLEVEVEVGMRDGHVYPFVGEGEPHLDGEAGDLNFHIRQQRHARFQRAGHDLYTNVTLSLRDALNGFTLNIPHLDSHAVRIQRDKVIWPGATIKKSGEGMPHYENNKERGDLYVTFDVEFPKNRALTAEEREAVTRLFGGAGGAAGSPSNQASAGSGTASEAPRPQVYNGLAFGKAAKKQTLM